MPALPFENPGAHRDSLGTKDSGSTAPVRGVWIPGAKNNPGETAFREGGGAGGRSTARGAGLKGNVDRGPLKPRRSPVAGAVTNVLDGFNLGMRFPGPSMEAPTNDPLTSNDYRPNWWVWARHADTAASFLQREGKEMLVFTTILECLRLRHDGGTKPRPEGSVNSPSGLRPY